MRRLLPPVLAMVACLLVGVSPAGAATDQFVYNSLPASGVVSVPSEGAEATQFNQFGNEVILTKASTVAKVSVTMVSWTCETGTWDAGDCVTTGTPTFPTPITLTLYKHSVADHSTGEVRPGAQIVKVKKTFNIKFRPSSDPSCPLEGGQPTMFRGRMVSAITGLTRTSCSTCRRTRSSRPSLSGASPTTPARAAQVRLAGRGTPRTR